MGSSTLTVPSRPISKSAIWKALLTAVLLPLVLLPPVIAVRHGSYDSFSDNAVTGFAMWGAFFVHMWTRPGRKEQLITVVLAVAMRVAYDLTLGERIYPGSLFITMGTFLGFASLLVIVARSLQASDERCAFYRRTAGALALLTYIGCCSAFYLAFAEFLLPRKFDYFLYNFDGSLGFQPSFLAGRLLASSRPLYWLAWTVYTSVGFWFAVLYAMHAGSPAKFRVKVAKMLVVNAVIGFSLYFFCPAMGPKYGFPSFPYFAPNVYSATVLFKGAPNAIPSLHFGSALLIFWSCRPWKWLYRFLGVYVALTALATLGLGEHYLIDLVVAVPYALAIMAFCSDVPERKLPMAFGAAMVFFWLIALRSISFHPAVAFSLVLATVALSAVLQRRLAERIWTAIE